MGLLQKLKSALGLDGATSSDTTRSDDVDVTVEREPSTEDEDAVKGTDTSAADSVDDTTDDADTAGTETTDTAADPDTTAEADIDEPAVDELDTDAAEPDTGDAAEDTADETDDEADADAAADADEADEDQEADEAPADDEPHEAAPEGSTDPVTELNGIGPAYADRLAGQGIDTVGELAVADPEAIAAETDLGAKRVTDWVEQAREY
jgi:predicted flap endonuclease-1-like 5' DNA nuclease